MSCKILLKEEAIQNMDISTMFRNCLYSSKDIPEALEAFEKMLTETQDPKNIAHAAKIRQYRLLMKNRRFLSSLRKNFNELYKKITALYPETRFVIEGRRKSILSYEMKILKSLSEGESLDLIRDMMGLRIVLFGEATQEQLEDCYEILEMIITFFENKGYILCESEPINHHEKVPSGILIPKQSKISPLHAIGVKDYLLHPKSNGYQSLHSVFRTVNGECFEVQVRTMQQHVFAESSLANHRDYKKEKYGDSKIDLDYSKIQIPGFQYFKETNELFDFIGLEKSLLILQRNKTF